MSHYGTYWYQFHSVSILCQASTWTTFFGRCKLFLSEKLNQDTLEEHFGKQRIRTGSMDNPSMQQYMYNERNIIAAQSEAITSMHRNNHRWKRENVQVDINDERTLPKRTKK